MFGKRRDRYDERMEGGTPLKLAIAVIGCLAILMAMGAYSSMGGGAADNGSPSQSQDAASGGGPSDEEQELEISDAQRSAISSYGSAESELIDMLTSSSWANEEDGSRIEFKEESFSMGGSERSFAITAVKPGQSSEQDAGDGVKVARSQTEAVLLTSGGDSHFMTIDTEAYSGSDPVTTIKSDLFSSDGGMFVSVPKPRELSITNVDADLEEAVGDDIEGLTRCLADYAERYYPAAERAAWDGTVTVNYAEGVTVVPFELEISSSPRVSVMYDMQEKTFEAGASR